MEQHGGMERHGQQQRQRQHPMVGNSKMQSGRQFKDAELPLSKYWNLIL
jgi:hypothetical protein